MKKLESQDISDIISLSPIQKGMLFYYLNNRKSNLYFEQLSLRISGNINPKLFKQTWNLLLENNEMLRTVFRWEGINEPIQVILKNYNLPITEVDYSHVNTDQHGLLLKKLRLNDRNKGFDLTTEPFRIILCKLKDHEYEMIISNHHILYDGWSNSILLKEFFETYNGLYVGLMSPNASNTFFLNV